MHAHEGYSGHFVCLSVNLSVCLSVADLKGGGLLVFQRDMNLKRPCSREKVKKLCRSNAS